ncbi:MAG: hypothetical protein EOP45_19140 [Sphingobacteriaceae bacterium]|nr:MAG: hypothetical protein EOP45_19140 [Sphingobacteriaceae bacterium]
MGSIQAINKFFPLVFLLLAACHMGYAPYINYKNAGGANTSAEVRPLSAKAKAKNHNGNYDTCDDQVNLVHMERFLKEY